LNNNKLEIQIPHNYTPRLYQLGLWNAMIIDKKKRVIYVWHRRAGKDLLALNRILYSAMFEAVGTYWHIFPSYAQGAKSVWQETNSEGRKYIDYIPKSLIAKKNEKELKITLKNGSIYQIVGSDNPDSLRGAGIKGAVFSEYAEQDPRAWATIQPMLLENNGWAMFNFTPKGQNHAYELFKMAQKMPEVWHSEIKTAEETGVFTQEQLEQVKAEILSEGKTLDFFNQEFLCSFNNPIEGAYYSKIIDDLDKQGRIGNYPWEQQLPVYTFWDLGVGDATTIWFAQFIGNEIRIIDYIEDNNRGLNSYIKEVKDKPYIYEQHFAPHDIQIREFSNGKSRLETAMELGLRFSIAPKLSIEDGIDAVRSILPKCFFNETTTRRGLLTLKNYKKEFDNKNNTFKLQPKHDWASHGADAFRYLAVSYRKDISQAKQQWDTAISSPLYY
jgi:phage terminase large subunit